MMRRTWWLWLLTLTLFVLIPGVVLARQEADANRPLSQTLLGQKALRLGDRGPAVAALQRLLADRGFDPGKQDGVFGPRTQESVRQAQAALGLSQDGLAGVQTTSALEGQTVRRPSVIPADLFHADGGVTAPREPSASLVLHAADVPAPTTAPAPQTAGSRTFALTFNGAADSSLLPQVLAALDKHGMKATFFVTGDTPVVLLKAIADAGHEIGLAEDGTLDLTQRQWLLRLTRSQRNILAATGREATQLRPSRGLLSSALAGAAADLGLRIALWTNVTVSDHPDLSPSELTEALEGVAYPGSVIMLHQDRPGTVQALDATLGLLAKRQLRSVPLSDLVDR